MNNLELISEKILKAGEIVIASHVNPDGDSIGSLLSLGLGLERLGKKVHLVCQDDLPRKYRLLPGANRVVKKIYAGCDLAIAVDCSNKEILGKVFEIFEKAGDILEIDHHEARRPFGNLQLIDAKAAAVGELVYLLLNKLGVVIDEEIAQNILTSIIVETNSFRLPNVRPSTFELSAGLSGIVKDYQKLTDVVYWSKTRESVILSGICLTRCKFLNNGRVVWSIIRKKDYASVKGEDADVDEVADLMRSIEDVRIAVLFREQNKDHLRVSLRSKGENVAAIAEFYNGGGHFDVAGCTIFNNKKSIENLLAQLKKLTAKKGFRSCTKKKEARDV